MSSKGINMSLSVCRQKQASYTSYIKASTCHKRKNNTFSSLLNYWNSFGFEEQIKSKQAVMARLLSILTIWQLKIRRNIMQHNHNLAQSAYQ